MLADDILSRAARAMLTRIDFLDRVVCVLAAPWMIKCLPSLPSERTKTCIRRLPAHPWPAATLLGLPRTESHVACQHSSLCGRHRPPVRVTARVSPAHLPVVIVDSSRTPGVPLVYTSCFRTRRCCSTFPPGLRCRRHGRQQAADGRGRHPRHQARCGRGPCGRDGQL